MTAEAERIAAADVVWAASRTPQQQAEARRVRRACVTPALSWLLYGNPNKPGGVQR